MAHPSKPYVDIGNLYGMKYFKALRPFLACLHKVGTERDHAGNRKFFFDDYASLVLLFFFNPVFHSLRALQQASCVEKIREALDCPRVSLGSFSEAGHFFDANTLKPVISELAKQALPLQHGKEAEWLKGLTAVDGTLLPALPKMAWALWIDEEHRAAKLHLHFDVLKSVPCSATITTGNGNEKQELRDALQPDRLYVLDRGYGEYDLFQKIIDAHSSFICRIRHDANYSVVEERTLSEEAHKAGVIRDCVVRLGSAATGAVFEQSLRIVFVKTGRTDSHGKPEVLMLATNLLDLDAAWVALAYKYRWTVELFFRWFKCILGCKHLLSMCENGVAIQAYLALIASILIVLWTQHKPSISIFRMLMMYFAGWLSDDELTEFLRKLHEPKKKKV